MIASRRAFLAGAGAALAMPAAARVAFKTEIIVRTVVNLRSRADVAALVAMAAQHGVSTINLATKQDEDDEIPSGSVFYASRIAPRAPGYETFDALSETTREAHRRGLRVRAWMPQFRDQLAANFHPDWRMHALKGGRFFPMQDVTVRKFSLIRLILRHATISAFSSKRLHATIISMASSSIGCASTTTIWTWGTRRAPDSRRVLASTLLILIFPRTTFNARSGIPGVQCR